MNSSAIGSVYEQSHHRLRAVATRLVGWHEAEDLVQDAFVNALKQQSSFRAEAALGTWVTRILINVAIDRCRIRKRRDGRHVPLDDLSVADTATTARLLPRAEDRILLLAALAALSQRDRQLAVLHYICGYTSAEIAQHFDVPDGTVKSRLFDIRRRLRAVACG